MYREIPVDPLLDAGQLALMEALPEAALLVARDGRVLHANDEAVCFLGRSWEEFPVEPSLSDLVPGAEDLIVGLGPAAGSERRLELEWSGSGAALALRARGISSESWLVLMDVETRGTSAGRALDTARDERSRLRRLVQRQREHLATVSHEMRTPMGAILGLMDTLGRTDLGPDQAQLVETVRASAEGMRHLVEGVFDYARVESGGIRVQSEHFSVADLVESVGRSLAPQAHRNGLELSTSIDPGLSPLHLGDARLVRQVLTNLASNALKFTREGEVHLRARLKAATDHHDVVALEVSDTGPGIPEGAQRRIFEPFVQADEESGRLGGSGLGLAVVRGVVERLGGHIAVESTLGKGSIFRISLRLQHAQRECPQRRLSDRAWPDAGVLLLGGTPGVQRSLAAACGHMGTSFWRLRPAELVRALEHPQTPRTVVLLDSTLTDGQRRAARADVAAARHRGVNVRAVDLLPATVLPGDDADRPDDVATLSKPVVRRALAVHLASEGVRFGTSGPRPSTRALRVLAIEDDPAIRLFLSAILPRMEGATVKTASTGGEGIEMSTEAEVVIVDESLPDARGRDVARRIREERGRGVVIVACSGYEEERFRAELGDGTFDAYLQKPYRGSELVALLEDLLARDRSAVHRHGQAPIRAAS